MKTLAELLYERSGKDLFLLCIHKNLPLPGEWTDREREEIIITYYSEARDQAYYLRILQGWEEGKIHPLECGPEEEELRKLDPDAEDYLDTCIRIGRRLRSIDESKKEYADILAENMLTLENVQSLLLTLKDPCMALLRKICAGSLKAENDVYPIITVPDKNSFFLTPETEGYALIQKTDPYDEPDDREHYTGIRITDDVVNLIREADTEDLEKKRSLNQLLFSLELIVQDYYGAAPIEVVHQLYSVLREENPDRYPAFSEAELDQAIVEFAESSFMPLYDMFTFHGKRYMVNSTDEFLSDGTVEEESYLADLLKNWEHRDVEPYIPKLAELQNFVEYGYWEARKPFRDLHQFLVEYYMDEQIMHNMGSGIMMLGMDAEERDAYRRKSHYSMDQVLEDADELFFNLMFEMMGGNEPGEIYKNQKDITFGLKDSAKRKFRRLLTKCCQCVPSPWRYGNSAES